MYVLPAPVQPGPLPPAESGGGRGHRGPGSLAVPSGQTGKVGVAAVAVVVCVSLEQSFAVPLLLLPAAVAVVAVALPGVSEALEVGLPL